MNDILLLTTNFVDGIPIERYYGLITANQVAGTGLFTDMMASFSDLFGGNSGAYRESMNTLYKDVTERLKAKAVEVGANAVIGVSIDYDSISAKSMSMFMISIQGTAVKLSIPNEHNEIFTEKGISWDILHAEYNKKKILRKLNENTPLLGDEWAFIIKNNTQELLEPLYNYYILCANESTKDLDYGSGTIYTGAQRAHWATNGVENYKNISQHLIMEMQLNTPTEICLLLWKLLNRINYLMLGRFCKLPKKEILILQFLFFL